MITVTVENLQTLQNELRATLGEDFMTKQVYTYRNVGLSAYESVIQEATCHPFALWWHALQQDTESSQKDRTLRLSPQSIRALQLLSDLNDTSSVPNMVRILDAIREKGTFYSACFEASVAAAYVAAGYRVEVVPESTEPGVRSTDLVVYSGTWPVYVECKSLEDVALKESQHWKELMRRVSEALQTSKRCWLVHIRSAKQIDAKECTALTAQIVKDIKANTPHRRELLGNELAVSYEKIAETDEVLRGPISVTFPQTGSLWSVQAEGKVGSDYIRNPAAILITPYIERDVSKRLTSEFKKAASQIPYSGPGIVHLALPFSKGSDLLEAVDTSYNALLRRLRNDSERVNAVVLTASVFEEQANPLVQNYFVVPNGKVRTELPKGFRILGTHDSGYITEDKPDEEGTVMFGWTPLEVPRAGIPAVIYDHSSPDGRFQLRFWRTWNGKFRFDVVTPSRGRLYVEGPEISLQPNVRCVIAGRWSKTDVSLFLNGQEVATCDLKGGHRQL